jgi:ribosomal protein L35
MKTNKSFTKRLRVTKRGKVLARKPGGNHFNAKESRTTQLKRKTPKRFKLKQGDRSRFLPGT